MQYIIRDTLLIKFIFRKKRVHEYSVIVSVYIVLYKFIFEKLTLKFSIQNLFANKRIFSRDDDTFVNITHVCVFCALFTSFFQRISNYISTLKI